MRFIRERLPREIPFKLSILSFIILLELCGIYFFVFVSLLKKAKASPDKNSDFKYIMSEMITFILLPLTMLDQQLKTLPFIEDFYNKFIINLSYKLSYIITYYYYFIIIIPKITLLLVLLVDTYYFHKLHYIYNIILIGSMLLLNTYLMYSLKSSKETLLNKLESYLPQGKVFITMTLEMIPLYEHVKKRNLTKEELEWEEFPPTFTVNIKEFIEYQIKFKVDEIPYTILGTSELYDKHFCKKYNINPPIRLFRHPLYNNRILEDLKKQEQDIKQISIILFIYELINNFDPSITKIKLLITANYLLCWVYILIISFHTLNISDFMQMLNWTWRDLEEPFTGLLFEENMVKNKYTRMAHGLVLLLKQLKEYLYIKITTWI